MWFFSFSFPLSKFNFSVHLVECLTDIERYFIYFLIVLVFVSCLFVEGLWEEYIWSQSAVYRLILIWPYFLFAQTIQTRNTGVRNDTENPRMEPPHEAGNVPNDTWDGPGTEHNSFGRGRRRGRGGVRVGRPQRRVTKLRNESGQFISATNADKFGPLLGWKGRPRGRGGRKRGRRTIKSRQKPAKETAKIAIKTASSGTNIYENTPNSCQQEWDEEETTPIQVEGAENLSSSERSEYDDQNGQATGDDYDDMIVDDYSGSFTGKSMHLMEGMDYVAGEENGNEDVDDDEEEEEDGDERLREAPVEEYSDSESEEEGNKFAGEEKMRSLTKGSEYSSSDYSD